MDTEKLDLFFIGYYYKDNKRNPHDSLWYWSTPGEIESKVESAFKSDPEISQLWVQSGYNGGWWVFRNN